MRLAAVWRDKGACSEGATYVWIVESVLHVRDGCISMILPQSNSDS